MTEKKGKDFDFYRFLEFNFGSPLDCMYCPIYGNLGSRIRVKYVSGIQNPGFFFQG